MSAVFSGHNFIYYLLFIFIFYDIIIMLIFSPQKAFKKNDVSSSNK